MDTKSTSLLLVAALAVAGCASSNGTSGSGVNAYDAKFYDGAGGNYTELLTEDGIVVFKGNDDGTVTAERIRFDAATNTLYVAKNGGAEEAYTYHSLGINGSGDYGTQFDGIYQNEAGERVYASVFDGLNIVYSTTVAADDERIAVGFGGVQTPLADLPESASYAGYYNMDAAGSASSKGAIALNVDFANGDVDGSLTNGTFYDGTTSHSYAGDITGTVSNGRVGGAATVTGEATGALDFAGAAMAPDGQYIWGGIAGTLNANDTDTTLGGNLNLFQQSQD